MGPGEETTHKVQLYVDTHTENPVSSISSSHI